MKLYLFRHAEKASPFHANPALSDTGLKQASRLATQVKNHEIPAPQHLWASPRLRAQQSFQALADQLGLKILVDNDLDERQSGEGRDEFYQRIKNVLQKAEQQQGIVYACSHSDWLFEALPLIPSETDLERELHSHWSPLQYLALQMQDGLYKFIETKRIDP